MRRDGDASVARYPLFAQDSRYLLFILFSRCSAVGSAPVSGTGGLEFESPHFDQKKNRQPLWLSVLFLSTCSIRIHSHLVRRRSHTPLGDRQACLPGGEREYVRPANTSTQYSPPRLSFSFLSVWVMRTSLCEAEWSIAARDSVSSDCTFAA